MIEIIPSGVRRAFMYFHSADHTSEELSPFVDTLSRALPDTYIRAGDGYISGSPIVNDGAFYGKADKRYWFMFPMHDAASPESFADNKIRVGASLLTAGAHTNALVDTVKERFRLKTQDIYLCGFQHGSCLALSTAMMRKHDPFKAVFLIQPYLMEALYLDNEHVQRDTRIICIENQFMRKKTHNWIRKYTDVELKKLGISAEQRTTRDGREEITDEIISEILRIMAG